MNYFTFFCGKSDDSASVVSFYFRFIRKNIIFGNCGNKCERFVEVNDKVVLEVFRYTATVFCRITDNFVFLRNYFYIRTLIECVYDNIGILGLRICETEHHGTFGRGEFGGHIMIGQIHLIIIRSAHFRFVREPTGTSVLVEYQSACDRHDGKLTVVIHPGTGLVGLLESPNFVGIICVCPAITHLTGLRCPEIHPPRQCCGGICIPGRQFKLGLSTYQSTDIIYRVLYGRRLQAV